MEQREWEKRNHMERQDQVEHSIRKNTILSIFISGIGYLYPLLTFVYIARILHPEGLGRVSFASSIAAYFVMFTGLGMPIYGLRSSAAKKRLPQERSRFVAEMLLMRLLSGLAVWIVFLLADRLFLMSRTGEDHHLLMIYGMGVLAAIPECSWLYQGMEDYHTLAWTSTIGRLGGLIALFTAVRTASDINKYAWISVLIPFVISGVELVVADRKWDLRILAQLRALFRPAEVCETVRKHIRPLMLFMLMSCAVTVYSHTDAVMLGWMQSKQAVGLYSCAAKIKSVLPVLTGALWAAALPKSAELWRNQEKTAFRDLAEKSFHVIYMVMLPLTVYFFLFAEPWTLLIAGDDYLEAVRTMRLLLLAVIPIGFSNIIGGQMLIPMGKEKKLFQAEVVGAVSNIMMNAFLIPVLSSAGAAIATTVSEVLVTAIAMLAALKTVQFRIFQPRNLLYSSVGCIVAGLAALGTVRVLPLPLIWKGLLSFVVFALLFTLVMLLFHDSLYNDLLESMKRLLRKVLPVKLRARIRGLIYQTDAIRFRVQMMLFPAQMKLYCPCCGMRFRAFAAGEFLKHPESFDPARYRNVQQEVICPLCGALPRHRILANWCDAHREELQTRKILYFAPEHGMMQWMKRNGITCTTADLCNPADLRINIQETGLPEASWDVVICNHVLEHVDDFRLALKELYRILRPGGRLICSFPMDPNVELVWEETGELPPEERIRRFGQYDHKRVFGMHADQLLAEVGFEVDIISGEACPQDILPVIGPGDYDMNCLFDCKKSPGDGSKPGTTGTVS